MEKTRYTDSELEEFRELILKKLANAKADYDILRSNITHASSNDTEDTSPPIRYSKREQPPSPKRRMSVWPPIR